MNHVTFDTLTRHAARRVSRRASLIMLGTAGPAAFASPTSTEAKNKKTSAGKKARQKCQEQVGQCTTFLTPSSCDSDCLAVIQRCCAFVGSCDIAGFVLCLEGA